MSGDILTVKTVKRVRSVRGSALVHIKIYTHQLKKSLSNFLYSQNDNYIVITFLTNVGEYRSTQYSSQQFGQIIEAKL